MIFKTDLNVVLLEGPDSRDFIHRLSTANLKTEGGEASGSGAFLQATGKIRFLFRYFIHNQKFFLVVADSDVKPILEFLEQMHFSEDFTIKHISDLQVLRATGMSQEDASLSSLLRESFIIPLQELSQEDKLLITGKEITERNKTHLQSSQELDEVLIANDIPQWKKDFGEESSLLELPLSQYLAPNKGCYPGQEVIEKTVSYGGVPKKLVILNFVGDEKDLNEKLNAANASLEVFIDGKKSGIIKKIIPGQNKAWAFMQKPHYKSGLKVTALGLSAAVKIFRVLFLVLE